MQTPPIILPLPHTHQSCTNNTTHSYLFSYCIFPWGYGWRMETATPLLQDRVLFAEPLCCMKFTL